MILELLTKFYTDTREAEMANGSGFDLQEWTKLWIDTEKETKYAPKECIEARSHVD